MKYIITIHKFIILILLTFAATIKVFAYQADVVDISEEKYFPAVKEALSKADKSIHMVMYRVGLSPDDAKSSVYQLVEELIKARKRGVNVRLILDRNIRSVEKGGIQKYQIENKSALCCKMLKSSGIDVLYDDPALYAHAKAIIIDREIVILGSANWTEHGLHKNFETNALIKSKELAGELLKRFDNLYTETDVGEFIEPLGHPVPISWVFLEDPKFAGKMISKNDERVFDLYLLLLRYFKGTSQVLNFEKTAISLDLYKGMSRTAYRRQIIRSLRKLEKIYHLIKFEPRYAKDAVVTLTSYNNPAQLYTYPKEWYFQLPSAYYDYGWGRILSLRAKFCYLINLAYASISDTKPWWFSSRYILSKRFNVSKYVISKGMGELRRWGIIDVEYSTEMEKPNRTRFAKSYKVMDLYDPSLLEKEWDRLRSVYGEDKLKKAKQYAYIVFKENDFHVVEDIIININTLGPEKVDKAFNIVSQKNPDNPKKCYQYVNGILRKLK